MGFHEAMGEAARLMGLESTMDGPGLVAVQDKA